MTKTMDEGGEEEDYKGHEEEDEDANEESGSHSSSESRKTLALPIITLMGTTATAAAPAWLSSVCQRMKKMVSLGNFQ